MMPWMSLSSGWGVGVGVKVDGAEVTFTEIAIGEFTLLENCLAEVAIAKLTVFKNLGVYSLLGEIKIFKALS